MMKSSKELKIGIFVVCVLVVSFFLINYLRGEDIFDNEIELVSRYDNLEGLVPSAPVFIKGYKAGKVSEVTYDSAAGDFIVVCSVRKEFVIPVDSKMTIYSVDIMGGKGIRIDLGSSDVAASDGYTLVPDFEAGLMDGLAGGMQPLLAKVNNTLDSLVVTVTGVNRLLSEENSKKISSTLAHLERTMASASDIAASVDGKSAELEIFIDNLAALSEKFNVMADSVDSVMTDVSAVTASLSKSDIEGVVTSLKSLLENINDPDGTVGKLLTDGSVYDTVDELLVDVDELIRKIQGNPKKYLKISVF